MENDLSHLFYPTDTAAPPSSETEDNNYRNTSMILLSSPMEAFSGSHSNDQESNYNPLTSGLVLSQDSIMLPKVSYPYLEEEYNFDILQNWDIQMGNIDFGPPRERFGTRAVVAVGCDRGGEESGVTGGLGSIGGVGSWEMRTWNGKLRSTSLGFDEISKYFYMTINDAAKELNVGLTLLKKRCRELGIPRWPHRKMKSLKSLIHNIQELGNGRKGECMEKEVLTLEEHKKLMEKMPQLELSERAKRLRQACFKASYKKRKQAILSST